MIPKVKILNYALFTGFWLLCWSCQNEQCKLYDAVFADLPSPVDAGWLVQEEADTADVNNESRLIAKFELKNGGTTHFVNLGETGGAPQIGLITVNSKISRGRSPQSTLMSPMEIFLSLADEGVSTPTLLVRHHQSLARLARFDSIPRMFTSPPWSGGGLTFLRSMASKAFAPKVILAPTGPGFRWDTASITSIPMCPSKCGPAGVYSQEAPLKPDRCLFACPIRKM